MADLIEHSHKAFEIPAFLSPEVCGRWVEWAEARGYEAAVFSGEGGARRIEAVRNNDRIIEDSDERAALLQARLMPLLPAHWRVVEAMRRGAVGRFEVCGLNTRFRWYRYVVGQRFHEHVDKMFKRDDGAVSFATVLVYLSGDVGGGQTRVKLETGERLIVSPQVGSLLCFDHQLLHEGMPVESGTKHVLRTDLMYIGSE